METVDIKKDETVKRVIIVNASGRALYRSASPPKINIKIAAERVPDAYIAPQREWLILK